MKPFIIIAVASLLTFFTGCTTARIADYQPASPSVTERTIQQSGVEISLDPFVDKDRTMRFFDIDAVANGIAILHVRASNKTAGQTFLVEKNHFQLIPDGSGAGITGEGKKDESSNAGQTKQITAAVLYGVGSEVIGVGFFLAGLAEQSHSSEIQRNFVGKEMPDQTLSPGKSMEGFVYFKPVKKGEDWSRTAAVKIILTETKTQQMMTLNIPLSH